MFTVFNLINWGSFVRIVGFGRAPTNIWMTILANNLGREWFLHRQTDSAGTPEIASRKHPRTDYIALFNVLPR